MRQAPKRRHLRSRAAIFEKLEWRTLLASISGIEFSDLNGNGNRELNEPALSGWTVYLDLNHNGALNGAEPSVVTGASGQFSFTNLSPGNYTLRQVVPAGWEQTHPGGAAPSLAPMAAALSSSQTNNIPSAVARMTDLSQYGVSRIRGAHSWVVGLKHGASIRTLAKTVGATSYRAATQLSDTYIVKFNPHQIGQSSAMHLGAARGVAFFYPMISGNVGPRSIPDDPLFPNQWDLQNTGQNGGTAGQDANITSVWDNYQGNGVTIGIVDSGVDYTHPDLAPNYSAASSFDFLDNDSDPAPVANVNHGTEVAGIAGARGNNTQGISGAAPQATLAALRLFSGNSPTSDQQIADALSHLPNSISIYNNSWGPPDTGLDLSAPGPLTLGALQNGVTNGRNGLGSIYVWAAGNGLLNNDNVNYDGYANSRYALAVTAIDNNGVQPPYAEPGAAILVSAYSSGIGAGTTSTSNGGNYTNTFGETSSAAPLVSGVVALMLQANPSLGWRDVEHILALSARKNDAADSQWTTNGAGLHVNNKYGFGAIDAAAAVSLAVDWNNVAAETSFTSGALSVNQAIPDDDTTGLTETFDVTQSIRAETVEVVFDATHTDRGDLRVVLISPDGTQSVLAEPHFDSNADYDHWTFATKRDWDEMATGTWTLKVTDESGSEVGTLNSWQLNIYGTAVDPNSHDIVIASASDSISGMDFGNHDTAAPNSVAIVGPTISPEGTPINLTAAIDPAGSYTYAWTVTKNGNPYASGSATGLTFTPDDNGTYVASLTVTDTSSGNTSATPLTIDVTNVTPTIALSGNASTDEGSTYSLNLGAITDPGTDTVSLYRITWGDGSAAENFTPQQIIDAGGVVTHVFDDGPSDKTITVRLGDEDGIAIAGTLAVHVNNLDPTGMFASGGDVNISEDGFVIWLTPGDPSTEDASNLVYDYDFNNDGTFDVVGSLSSSIAVPGSYLTSIGSHTVRSRIRDNDGQVVDGAARDGVLEQTTTINVVNASLRVLGFTPSASGFSVRFNKPVLSNLLNLYDGNDAAVDLPDVVVTRASDPTHPVRGSLVWDSSTNTVMWVATGGVLANDTYGVRLVSGSAAWTAGAGDTLDGEPDTAGLEDYQQQFVVNWSNRSVSLPDFARGAGQNVNLPANLAAGIPISISNPQGVTSVDFNLFYNPQLLDITAAALASGVPAGWTLTSNFTNLIPTLSRVRITMSSTSQLSSGTGAMQIVKLTANVPTTAPYGSAQVLRIENVVINGGNGRGDYALHEAAYVGDANHNSAYSGADSALISRVVAELDSGFDSYATVDPLILADVDANAQVQGQDAAWVLQKSLLASLRPEIPDIPFGAPFSSGSGPLDADVTIDIPEAIPAANAGSVLVPLNLDSVAGLMGFNVTVVYDKNRLSLADGADSTDVSLGQLFATAGGWTMASYVQQDTGKVVMGFYRSDPIESSFGNFGNLNFHVAPDAPSGTLVVTPIGLPVDDPFSFNYSFGTLEVVATGPTVTSSGFHLDPGSPMSVQLVFSGDVSASLSTADVTVTNQLDSTIIPSASLALSYNPGTNTATLTFLGFANGVLPDGNYQVVVNAAGVKDQLDRPMQTSANMEFFFLNGDANHDRVVDTTDLLALASNYQTARYDFSKGDLNFDGLIDSADLAILAANWQKVLPESGGLSLRSVSNVSSPQRRTPARPLALDLPLS